MYLAANKIANGSVYREVRQGLVDMNAMFSLLNLKSQIKEKPNAKVLTVHGNDISVQIKDVHFGYLPGKPILNGLSMEIPAGKKVAIVGGSGSGKSTLVRLLYRLYDAEKGTITINGEDIHDLTLESLRKVISVVPQDSVLFHDTIFYNLAYGNPKASTEEVYQAAKLADLHYSVESMPNGYSTIVGERGLKLSGGEKQRVAIARAILKVLSLIILMLPLVLRRATSSLDAITEANIMRSLKEAIQKRTSLFIAHRLATIYDADIIYVLDRGQVKEFGSHDELMRRDGLFALVDARPSRPVTRLESSLCRVINREYIYMHISPRCFKPQINVESHSGSYTSVLSFAVPISVQISMSGCLDQISCNCNIDLDGKRNAIASVTAATLFSVAWWIMIDTSAVYGK
ncbi:ABC transporter, ATP-binding protein, partial [Cooperia oncophora]